MRLLRFILGLAVLVAARFVCADELPSATNDQPSIHALVDHHISSGFKKWKVVPAARCTDSGFVRRIHLDLTGVIPNQSVTLKFISDASKDKREKLIDQLLASQQFADHMAVVFDVMLMERRPDKYVTTAEWRTHLSKSFAENKPLNKLASEILGADGVDKTLRPAAKFYLDRAVDKDLLVRDIGRLFLGVDLQCAQCHDHPEIDDYLHVYYHGLSVFVSGSKTFRQKDGTTVLQEMVTREVEFVSVFEPDKQKKTGPRLLEALLEIPDLKEGEEYVEKPSRTVRAVPKFSLRKLLAEKLPQKETPEFARNMANRLWAMMMGRGIVHPLDMHHSGNPASHPELLAQLGSTFAQNGYDVKKLLREFAISDTYQRSSLVPEGVAPDSVPEESFAVANMKGLSPEQLFNSLLEATDSRDQFAAQIDRALKEDAEAFKQLEADKEKLAKAREDARAAKLKEFVSLFGATVGSPEGEFQASLPQALFLANSETVSSWIEPGQKNLTATLATSEDNPKVVEQAYYSVLSRQPSAEELEVGVDHLTQGKDDRQTAIVELVWSLVASAEFRLNH
jgi:hypothetical protein